MHEYILEQDLEEDIQITRLRFLAWVEQLVLFGVVPQRLDVLVLLFEAARLQIINVDEDPVK